jgi:hypothetical protein
MRVMNVKLSAIAFGIGHADARKHHALSGFGVLYSKFR